MKTPWFKPCGWFYLPVAWQGVMLAAITLAFWVQIFCAIDRHSHSVSDTLYGVFPYFASSFLLLDWIAGRTSLKHHTHPIQKEASKCNAG